MLDVVESNAGLNAGYNQSCCVEVDEKKRVGKKSQTEFQLQIV